MIVGKCVYGVIWYFFVGCQWSVLVDVGVVSGVVVIMECCVLDFILVLHPAQGRLVLCFVVVSYNRFGVKEFIFFCICTIYCLLFPLCIGSLLWHMCSIFVSGLEWWLFACLVFV